MAAHLGLTTIAITSNNSRNNRRRKGRLNNGNHNGGQLRPIRSKESLVQSPAF
jgi:hypothetical protein